MKNKILICSLVAITALTSSCAGLISGKTQTIFLRPSNGAEDVEVEVASSTGTQTVSIPASVVVARNKMPLTITVKEGKCVKENKTFAPTKYNIFLLADGIGGIFGLTGTTIDMNSGAAWTYEDNIFVDIKSKQGCK